MTDSVEILEHIANEETPALKRSELEAIRDAFGEESSDKDALRERLSGMATSFRGRGNVTQWRTIVLEKIDECFEQHFMSSGAVYTWVFVPDNAQYLNAYARYCAGVDRILSTYSHQVPRHARDYFAYYSIWEVQGYAFPMPLGTSKVVSALETTLNEYRDGVIEVR